MTDMQKRKSEHIELALKAQTGAMQKNNLLNYELFFSLVHAAQMDFRLIMCVHILAVMGL